MDGAMLNADSAIRPDPLEQKIVAERARKAARRVATAAVDAADCGQLLEMLGLTPEDGLTTKGTTR